jgi:hypothetical protein
VRSGAATFPTSSTPGSRRAEQALANVEPFITRDRNHGQEIARFDAAEWAAAPQHVWARSSPAALGRPR